MIDTEKYEGHTPAPWEYNTDDDGWTLAAIRERDDPDRDEFIALITERYGLHRVGRFGLYPDLKLIADAPLLLAEVKRLREELDRVKKECGALWSITENWSMCEDDYTMHDQYENLDERYACADWGIILKELYTYTEEDGWQPKEMIE